jgi:hypothetical protein
MFETNNKQKLVEMMKFKEEQILRTLIIQFKNHRVHFPVYRKIKKTMLPAVVFAYETGRSFTFRAKHN